MVMLIIMYLSFTNLDVIIIVVVIIYYYYVRVAHWIGLNSKVKFLEVLRQQNSSNLKNILEDPCRI